MNLRQSLAKAIQSIRKAQNLTQEDFGIVSSRTYLSSLERGLKSPTVDKLDEIARVMGVHPASVVLIAYAIKSGNENQVETIDLIAEETKLMLMKLLDSRQG